MDMSDERFEEISFDFAVDMTLVMFDNLYQRTKIMMDSFTEETMAQWYSEWNRQLFTLIPCRERS